MELPASTTDDADSDSVEQGGGVNTDESVHEAIVVGKSSTCQQNATMVLREDGSTIVYNYMTGPVSSHLG